jgi:hypothetical protein
MTDKKHTGIDLDVSLSGSPEEIAEKIVNSVITPILKGAEAKMGENLSLQLYMDILYKLVEKRVCRAGYDAIHEIKGIASELEEECFGQFGEECCPNVAKEFYEIKGIPS